MVEKPSSNPVDQKTGTLSENPAVQNPTSSSDIQTGITSDNPSVMIVELKPDTSTGNETTLKSDTRENPAGRISDVPPETLSETKPVCPEKATDPGATVDYTSEAKGSDSKICCGIPMHSDDDIFVDPKNPSILSVRPENPTDPEISNPSENPTISEISNTSENTPQVSIVAKLELQVSATEVSQLRSAIFSVQNFLGCTLKQIMYMFLFYTLIGLIIAIGIFYDCVGMIAIFGLLVVIGICAVRLSKCCYGMIAKIVADRRSENELSSNASNPSPPEILQDAKTAESVIEAPVPVTESLEEPSVDIKSSEKDEDAAQEVVEEIIHLTQEKETVRHRHVGDENK